MKKLLVSTVALAVLALAPPAHAGDLTVSGGAEAQTTSWEDDAAGYAALKTSYLFGRIGPYLALRAGAASIDERALQSLGAGGELRLRAGRFRPTFRLGFSHQHELAKEDLEEDPSGSLLGYGDGVRHRSGISANAELQMSLGTYDHGEIYAATWLSSDRMLGSKGPAWYLGGGLSLGIVIADL